MQLFTRILLGYLPVILVAGVGVAVTAGLVSPRLYQAQLDQIALLFHSEFVGLRVTLEEGHQRTMLQALGIALPVSLLLAAGIAYLQTRQLVARIRKLAEGSRDIADGHYERRLEVTGGDELAVLADDFNAMARTLEHAEQKRVELIGAVAHELQTPLAVQQGYTEALVDGMVSPEEAAGAIMYEVRAMRRLTHDLSLLTRIEAGAFDLQLAPHRPEELVADVLDRFMHAFEEKGLVLETELAEGLEPVYADRERVAQILGNLLSNALRYAPGPGRVVLCAQPCEGCVEFSVSDSGPGISARHQTLIFRRFYRLESPPESGGTGIGLTVVQGLVKAMGGRIWVQSQAGEGATFTFTLPVRADPG